MGRVWVAVVAIAMCLSNSGQQVLGQEAAEPSRTAFAGCPPGTDPDAPGPEAQVRPQSVGVATFDSHAGGIVAIADGGGTWTFDVCTNTWSHSAAAMPPVDPHSIDPETASGLPTEETWHFRLIAYDAEADRYVAYVGDACVGFPPADLPEECPGDRTWLLDPEAGVWSEARALTPDMSFGFVPSGREMAFDEATGHTVIFSDGRVISYDVTADAWEVLHEEPPFAPPDPWSVGPLARLGHTAVYDPVNERLVVMGGQTRTGTDPMWMPADDVWAFDARTRRWTELLAPSVAYPTPAGATQAP